MPKPGVDLRHLRTFVAVAQRRNFSRAAEDLNIAQQAASQQIKVLERALGVTLLRRTSRQVELTREGTAFLTEARRVLAAADNAVRRVRAVARGEAGTLRLAYTYTAAFDTIPKVLARLEERHPQVRVESREVLGAEVADALLTERFDLAVAPRTSYPRGFHSRVIRREPLGIVMRKTDPVARRKHIELATVADRLFEIWPREMAPGLHDTIVGYCRAAGFEPKVDEQATGNTVWRNLARGRGVTLINQSVMEQAPATCTFVPLAPPGATVTIEAVWHDDDLTLISHALKVAAELAKENAWV